MATLALTALTSMVAPEVAGAAGGASILGSIGDYLPSLATVADVGGGILKAVGDNQQAQDAKASADFVSEEETNNENSAMAAGESEAQEELYKTKTLQERATALEGASGADAGSPTAINLNAQVGVQGEYNAATDLYNGESRAAADQNAATAAQFNAKMKAEQLQDQGLGAIAGGAFQAFSQKYGSDPTSPSPNPNPTPTPTPDPTPEPDPDGGGDDSWWPF